MTSKISCFDRAVFRRALKKTAPVWILFTLYELLLPFRLISFCRGLNAGAEEYLVQIERMILSYAQINASVVPFVFGGLLAWGLFFWLFRAGSAYFYAALPVRRETLFLTYYLTGLMLCAAPALLSSLLVWAVGAGFGVSAAGAAAQLFAATMLGFVLFFSFAVLICMVIGQTAAVPIVYVMLNFAVYVLEVVVRHLMVTFVYGMSLSQSERIESLAQLASPVLGLLQGGFRVVTDWTESGVFGYETNPHLVGWGYLGILAGVGAVFAVCAFLLLRQRQMERSGDVIAVGWLRPVALYGFTIGCALVLGVLLTQLFSDNTADNFWYVLLLLFLGAFLGYFSGKMLLQKTVHVFRSGWGGFAGCCLALLLVFGSAEFDLFGYCRYLPPRGAIAAAGLTQNQFYGQYTTAQPEMIDSVLALHAEAIREKSAQEHRRRAYQTGEDNTQSYYITYRMADGSLVERHYNIIYDEADLSQPDSLICRFDALYNSPACVLLRTGFDVPRTQKNVLSCYVYSADSPFELELTGADAWRVYEACRADLEAGRLGAEDVSGMGTDGGNYTPLHLIFTVTADTPGQTLSLRVESIPLDAEKTVQTLTGFGADPYWQAAG